MSRRLGLMFGDNLVDRFVSIVFGQGIFALRGVVISVQNDYLEVRKEKDENIVQVPLASIVYITLGVKQDA